jgi:tRNA pseudouridine38-40 synthase
VAVRQISAVHPGFHPRFDAIARRYEYRLFCQPVREPLRERFAWRVWPPVAGAELAAGAAVFLGTHDFSSFGSPSREEKATARTITRSDWSEVQDGWKFQVECGAFLYRMVRRMVFSTVAVARGHCTAEAITVALAEPDVRPTEPGLRIPPGLAPAQGLTLVDVNYGSIDVELKRRYESVQDVLSESR